MLSVLLLFAIYLILIIITSSHVSLLVWMNKGRASTMMCAWLMSSEGHTLKSAVTHMKQKRSVVSTAILKYDVLHELERDFSANKNK